MVKKENDFLAGKCIYSYVNNINIQINGNQAKKKMTFQRKNAFMSMLRALGISKILKIYIHEALLRNAFSRRFQPALASVSVRFRSKERGTKVKMAQAKERPKPRIPFLGLSPGGGGGTRRKIEQGCAARFPKPLPYL